MSRSVTVLEAGPLATVQDMGRPGQGAMGIGRSGACDRASHRLANRLLGNPPEAAVIEVTFGGLSLRAEAGVTVATTGARCRSDTPHNTPVWVAAGDRLVLGPPESGLRTYVAVRGGVAVEPVLGSRSTDILAGLGPPALQAGTVLPIGEADEPPPGVDLAPVADPAGGEVTVRVLPGPRLDWFSPNAWDVLTGQPYAVTGDCDRVGVRLEGTPLERSREGELPSEGMVRGALQVPPSGTPVLFLADHPVTGGYPVVGYVADEDVDRCGQLSPGQSLRFRGAAERVS